MFGAEVDTTEVSKLLETAEATLLTVGTLLYCGYALFDIIVGYPCGGVW
jgi:hypothetical protein